MCGSLDVFSKQENKTSTVLWLQQRILATLTSRHWHLNLQKRLCTRCLSLSWCQTLSALQKPLFLHRDHLSNLQTLAQIFLTVTVLIWTNWAPSARWVNMRNMNWTSVLGPLSTDTHKGVPVDCSPWWTILAGRYWLAPNLHPKPLWTYCMNMPYTWCTELTDPQLLIALHLCQSSTHGKLQDLCQDVFCQLYLSFQFHQTEQTCQQIGRRTAASSSRVGFLKDSHMSK